MAIDNSLPPLRQDVYIEFNGYDIDGAPTWLIRDKLREVFIKIGYLEFHFLSRWAINDKKKLLLSIKNNTTLSVNMAMLEDFIAFLHQNQLINNIPSQHLCQLTDNAKQNVMKQLLLHYLFFKIALLKPDRFLRKSLPYIRFLFNPRWLALFGLFFLLGLYMLVDNWHAFRLSYESFFSLDKMMLLAIAIFITKSLHELGHAYSAKYFGCRVKAIGVAFIVMFPVLYTDVSDTWRMHSRKKRLLITMAGMMVEMSLAATALLLWGFLEPGTLKDVLCYIVSISLVSTLLINLNPVLKFDGYYALSDILAIDNLQQKAFKLARWQLREWLFNLGEHKPIHLDKEREKIALIYAYVTWIYRFFLFLGIALLVYFFFFKMLGIILMLVELYVFIVNPIVWEIGMSVQKLKAKEHITGRTKLTFLVLIMILSLFFIPWQNHLYIPAQVEFQQEAKIYAPLSGRIDKLAIAKGSSVKVNTPIVKLISPKLDYKKRQVDFDIAILKTKLKQEVGQSDDLGLRQANLAELSKKETEKLSLLREEKKLTLTAPLSGQIDNQDSATYQGSWVHKDQYLFSIVNTKTLKVVAFLPESSLDRIQVGNEATFFPYNMNLSPIDGTVSQIATIVVKPLGKPYQALPLGGELKVEEEQNTSEHKLKLKEAYYRVEVTLNDHHKSFSHIEQRGSLKVTSTRESLAGRFFRHALAVLIRESGF